MSGHKGDEPNTSFFKGLDKASSKLIRRPHINFRNSPSLGMDFSHGSTELTPRMATSDALSIKSYLGERNFAPGTLATITKDIHQEESGVSRVFSSGFLYGYQTLSLEDAEQLRRINIDPNFKRDYASVLRDKVPIEYPTSGPSNAQDVAVAAKESKATRNRPKNIPLYPPILVVTLPNSKYHFNELKTKLGYPPNVRRFRKGVRFMPSSEYENRIVKRYLTILEREERICWCCYSLPVDMIPKDCDLLLETSTEDVEEKFEEWHQQEEYFANDYKRKMEQTLTCANCDDAAIPKMKIIPSPEVASEQKQNSSLMPPANAPIARGSRNKKKKLRRNKKKRKATKPTISAANLQAATEIAFNQGDSLVAKIQVLDTAISVLLGVQNALFEERDPMHNIIQGIEDLLSLN